MDAEIISLLNKTENFGCIGSRDTSLDDMKLCAFIGYHLAVKRNKRIHSGNADGADMSYAIMANKYKPWNIYLYLPMNENVTLFFL